MLVLQQKKPTKRPAVHWKQLKVWAFMTYQCERCGKEIRVQLAVGVEGPRGNYLFPRPWVPAPMHVPCDE